MSSSSRFAIYSRWSRPVVFFFVIVSFGLSGVKAQSDSSLEIYRRAYVTAMEDGVLSPDEERLLRVLQEELGLSEDAVSRIAGRFISPSAPALDQSGRWTLVAQNMGWGAGLYGWGVPYVLDVEDDKWYTGGVMLSLAGSLYLTWRYTEHMELPEARSHMQRYGGAVGLQLGRAVNTLLGYWENDSLERGEILTEMLSVPMGVYLGDRLYRHWRPSTGQAYALSLYGELTAFTMRTVHRQLVPYPSVQNDYGWRDDDTLRTWRKHHLYFDLAGYFMGTYAGHRVYGGRQYTFGDAALLYAGRWAGTAYGVMLANLLEVDPLDEERVWYWFLTLGGVGGLVGMDTYIRGLDYTFGEAVLLTLGGIAGAGLPMGLGVVAEIEEHEYYDVTVIAGSLAGMLLTRKILTPVPESGAAWHDRRDAPIRIAFQPVCIYGRLAPLVALTTSW